MTYQAGAGSVSLERQGTAVVARPQVKMMDGDALAALARTLGETTGPESGIDAVVVDLGDVAILPSLALGRLVAVSNDCKARGLRLTLVRLRPQIRQVFAVTRLDKVFRFADTVEDAVKG